MTIMLFSMKQTTLTDVARACNVAVSTVSKALNSTGRMSAATRRMIKAKAEEMGYRKSRGPSTHHSGLVGLVTSDHDGRFSLPLLRGAETTLGAANHAALLMSSHGKPALEKSHIDRFALHGVDGLLVVGDTTNPRPPLTPNTTMGLPVVYTYDPSTDPQDCSVICDNIGAGSQAIEYLIGMGRRHIAVVGGSDTFQACHDRIHGAMEAFHLYGLTPTAQLIDRWSEEWGERAARLLVTRYPNLDGVYCLSDEIARGMLKGLMSGGKAVPQDVAVIGHDNWPIFCVNEHPTLTTFDNNIVQMGKIAARLLLDAIQGKPHHGTVTVECPIIMRESTEVSHRTPLRGTGWFSGLEDE